MELHESNYYFRTPNYLSQPKKKQGASINDIVGTEGMTRSGRYYTPNYLEEKEGEKRAGKCAIDKDAGLRNEPVTKAEANEFLKFIKHSEYNIVEQLHKVPAKISLLALLLKILNLIGKLC